jgi:uncharacterized damage-inducible protein DinB
MRPSDILSLFGFNYWANRHLLEVASKLAPPEWTAASDITTRGLRATLVHTLDVEWSWRLRLQKRPREERGPDVELEPADYPDVASLAAHWAKDEHEMRVWLASLDDDALEADWNDGGKGSFPLWYFLMHLITHSQQQRSDAAMLLTRSGHSPGNIEFLDFADTLPR